MDGIFHCKPDKNGSFGWTNIKELLKYNVAHEGVELTVTFEPTVIKSEKKRMYAYYMRVVLPIAMRCLSADGWQLMDENKTDEVLKSVCAKDFMYNEKTDVTKEYLLEKRGMTKERLRKYITDCIFWIESTWSTEEHPLEVPDSKEYTMHKETGSKFKSTKFKSTKFK